MPIAIACTHCDWRGKVPDTLAGKKGKCPTCGELIPIKKSAGPPPVRGSKGKADDEPDIVDDADFVEDEPRPKKSAGRRRDEDEDDRSRKRRRDDDEDDRPARSRRQDDDEDDRPSKSRRRPSDDDEDQRPSRSRRRAIDDDDDEDERPRKKKRPVRRRRPAKKSGMSSKRIGALLGGIFAVLVGGALLAWFLLGDGRRIIYPILLIIFGLIGCFQGATGAGLGDDDDDSDDSDDGDDGGGDD
jgi:hypothetical protein